MLASLVVPYWMRAEDESLGHEWNIGLWPCVHPPSTRSMMPRGSTSLMPLTLGCPYLLPYCQLIDLFSDQTRLESWRHLMWIWQSVEHHKALVFIIWPLFCMQAKCWHPSQLVIGPGVVKNIKQNKPKQYATVQMVKGHAAGIRYQIWVTYHAKWNFTL